MQFLLHNLHFSLSLCIDDAKLAAIRHTDGPLLIIAGPGSGKTRTIVEKVLYLLIVKQVSPEHILVSTFTEKAARELISRVSNRLIAQGIPINVNDLYIGTLHSIFLRLLEEHREHTTLSKNYRILDTFDLQYLIYKHIWGFVALDPDNLLIKATLNNWTKADTIIHYVSKIGEEDIDLDALKGSPTPGVRIMAALYERYRQLLEAENALDFTLIQSAFMEMLRNHPEVGAEIVEQFHYMLIDEYQDTNTIQEAILFALRPGERPNICVVGDDDQGLYRFRGATVRNILTFAEHFPAQACKVVKLETNYRSHPEIIRFYGNWMEQPQGFAWDRYRYPKDMKPQPGKKFHQLPAVLKIAAEDDQDRWEKSVCAFIRFCEDHHVITDKNQICFLFRSVKSKTVLHLIETLSRNGISVFAPRSDMFFARPEIKIALGILLLVFRDIDAIFVTNNINDTELLRYYKSCRDNAAASIREDLEANEELRRWLGEVSRLFQHMTRSSDYRLSSLLYECFQFGVLSRYLDVDLNGKAHDQRAAYNLAILSQIITRFEANERITVITRKNIQKVLISFFGYFLRFLLEGGIEEFEDFDEVTPPGAVTFMTVHQAKGLEFPITVVGSLEGVPRKQFTDLDVVLEEQGLVRKPFEPITETKYFDFWRLYYTAFSRAKNLLVLACNESHSGRKRPSKYFESIYPGVQDWQTQQARLKKLRADKVTVSHVKKEYSYTRDIISYERCPAFYKFFRALGFAEVRMGSTLFGALVHETIEDIHKAVLRGEAGSISEDRIEQWLNNNYNSLSRALMASLDEARRQMALEQVLTYRAKNQHQWDKIVEVEVMVSLVKEAHILKGKIDLIRGENGTVDIMDFKTDAVKPKVNDPAEAQRLAQYRRQLEIYAHILEERFDRKINKLHLYYTAAQDEVPYITWDRSQINIQHTIQGVDGVIASIEAKNFDNAQVEKCQKLCGNCDMRHYCKYK